MRLRPPLILWRLLSVELWRLLLITAVLLIVITSFAVAVQYLAQGKIGPVDALRFMGLAALPMLQYTLPFAAGFAATLAYHRLATENEAVASHAGGISHAYLLVPALVTGAILGVTLFVLANSAIPRMLRSMEEMVSEDAMRLFASAIDRGKAVPLGGDYLVHADKVRVLPTLDTPQGPVRQLWLGGLLILGLDDQGAVESEAAASQARIFSIRIGDVTHVEIKPQDLVAGSGRLTVVQNEGAFIHDFPSVLKDDPKFLSWSELEELKRNPRRMNFVDKHRLELASRLQQQDLIEAARAEISERGYTDFVDPAGQVYRLYASGFRFDWQRVRQVVAPPTPGEPIVVETRLTGENNGQIQRFEAQHAYLRFIPQPDAGEDAVAITLDLDDVTAFVRAENSSSASRRGTRSRYQVDKLAPVNPPANDEANRSSRQLILRADALLASQPNNTFISEPRNELVKRIKDLTREIVSKQHERLAMSAACLVMVFTGAVMGMRLRDAMPLGVYLWSFFPALAAVLTISTGQQTAHQRGAVGLVLLWGGVLGLAVYSLYQYRVLARR